jgi:hypothetical protein
MYLQSEKGCWIEEISGELLLPQCPGVDESRVSRSFPGGELTPFPMHFTQDPLHRCAIQLATDCDRSHSSDYSSPLPNLDTQDDLS